MPLNGAYHSRRITCTSNTHTEDMGQLIRKILARQNLVMGSLFLMCCGSQRYLQVRRNNV